MEDERPVTITCPVKPDLQFTTSPNNRNIPHVVWVTVGTEIFKIKSIILITFPYTFTVLTYTTHAVPGCCLAWRQHLHPSTHSHHMVLVQVSSYHHHSMRRYLQSQLSQHNTSFSHEATLADTIQVHNWRAGCCIARRLTPATTTQNCDLF